MHNIIKSKAFTKNWVRYIWKEQGCSTKWENKFQPTIQPTDFDTRYQQQQQQHKCRRRWSNTWNENRKSDKLLTLTVFGSVWHCCFIHVYLLLMHIYSDRCECVHVATSPFFALSLILFWKHSTVYTFIFKLVSYACLHRRQFNIKIFAFFITFLSWYCK